MKPKLLIGILVVLIALNLATIGSFVFMQWRRGGRDYLAPRQPDWQNRSRQESQLKDPPLHPRFRLDSEDRLVLRELLSDFYRDTEELRAHVRELEVEAFALMERDTVPRSELDSLLVDISAARFEIQRAAVDKLIESKEFLSPQQQKHFFQAILSSRGGRHMGMGPDHRFPRRQERGKRRGDR